MSLIRTYSVKQRCFVKIHYSYLKIMIQDRSTSTCSEEYITKCIDFFRKYQHLYKFPNTEIFNKNVLDEINIDNFASVDVFDKNFSLETYCDQNDFLKGFFEKLAEFTVEFNDFDEEEGVEDNINVPIGPKKRHEVAYLAKEIAVSCEEANCGVVVDFGSGLGYLDLQIFETTDLKVLGIECNETNYVGAKKRQRKYHLDSTERIKFIKHTIDGNSDEKLNEYLQDKFGMQPFCITGLHACADLTVDAINIFLKMADAKSLILMPCCYHKMKKLDDSDVEFQNFPLSRKLKDIFKKYKCCEYLNVPFLRLGAQPPCRNEGTLEDAVFNLLSRATLQLYALKQNYKLKRKKRKAVKLKTVNKDFSSYIADAIEGFSFIEDGNTDGTKSIDDGNTGRTKSIDCDNLLQLWRENSHDDILKKAAIFVLLQNHLQPVIEKFIMFDRICYLKENGVNNCRFKKIFNECLSPRCLALVAFK